MKGLYQQILYKFTWHLDCYMKEKLGHKVIHNNTIQTQIRTQHQKYGSNVR